jgi:[ribosomal protein S5]-alanine N-acetyltransferase
MRLLLTERLILEPLRVHHADALFHVLADPAIYTHEGQPPVSLDALRARYGRLEARVSSDGAEQWLNLETAADRYALRRVL